jgi:hypothetical protein
MASASDISRTKRAELGKFPVFLINDHWATDENTPGVCLGPYRGSGASNRVLRGDHDQNARQSG